MIRKCTYILASLFLISCQGTKDASSDFNISDETLIEVIVDLYMAENAVKNLDPEVVDSLKGLYRSQIEKIHKVNLSEVEVTLEKLQLDPKKYTEIHQAVEDTLAFRSKRLQ